MSHHLSTEQILEICLTALENGTSTLEECLARYPQAAPELEPLLRAALALQSLPTPQPSARFQRQSRSRLLAKLPEQEFVTFSGRFRHNMQDSRKASKTNFTLLLRRFNMTWIVILTLVGTLLGGGTVYASQSALPGDPLYTVKMSVEEVRLSLAGPETDVALLQEFAMERLEETETLLQQQRFDDAALALQEFQNTSMALQAALQQQAVPQEQIQQTITAMEMQMNAIAAQLQTMQQTGAEGQEAVAAQTMESLQHALEEQERSMEILHNIMAEVEDGQDMAGAGQQNGQDDQQDMEHNGQMTGTPTPEMDDEDMDDDMMTPTITPTATDGTPTPVPTATYTDDDDDDASYNDGSMGGGEEHSDDDYDDDYNYDDDMDEEHGDMEHNGGAGANGGPNN